MGVTDIVGNALEPKEEVFNCCQIPVEFKISVENNFGG